MEKAIQLSLEEAIQHCSKLIVASEYVTEISMLAQAISDLACALERAGEE